MAEADKYFNIVYFVLHNYGIKLLNVTYFHYMFLRGAQKLRY